MKIPNNVSAYKKTPNFSQDSVPSGLLKNHKTKAGTWGKIIVLKGEIEYCIQTNPLEIIKLTSSNYGVVEPEQLHFIKPLGAVEFYVEFYK